KGYGEGYTDGSGHEVVICETRHLREIAHGRFTAVRLPVRVGRKRGRRIERELRSDTVELLRIPRKHALEALDGIKGQHRYQAEQQHGHRVLGPTHFTSVVDGTDPVDSALDRSKHGVEPRALPIKYMGHES